MARKRDGRTYITVHDGMPDHPKVEVLSDAAFRLLVTTWCWCSRQQNGGQFSDYEWRQAGHWRARRQLVAAGLIERSGDGWQVHDWLPSIRGGRAHIPDALRFAVYDRDGWACVACGATEPLSLDHIWPWSLCGEDTYENLQTLCIPCNIRKGARV